MLRKNCTLPEIVNYIRIKNTKELQLPEEVVAINKIPIVPQLLDVICRTTNMGFAAIARVTDKKWITCSTQDSISFGLKPGDELDINATLCQQVHKTHKAIMIDDVETDVDYFAHPVPKQYNIKSYVSWPIYRKNGEFFGTLCAIDIKPNQVKTPEIEGLFALFADLISFHLEAVDKMTATEKILQEEREMAELRDKFIAILGHDLKNPIATIRMSSDILLKMSKEELTLKNAAMIKSTSFRMQSLIENILDFAKGKMGEGIILNRKKHNGSLVQMLEQVIKEVQISSPERKIVFNVALNEEVYCDRDRLGQLFSNLLSNADQHGDPDAPVEVFAVTTPDHFELKVTNKGEDIPADTIERLFQPFYRNHEEENRNGLGLGLFIASEIAKAHSGNLTATSAEQTVNFVLQIPLKKK